MLHSGFSSRVREHAQVVRLRVKVFTTTDSSINVLPSLKLMVAILEDSTFYTW